MLNLKNYAALLEYCAPKVKMEPKKEQDDPLDALLNFVLSPTDFDNLKRLDDTGYLTDKAVQGYCAAKIHLDKVAPWCELIAPEFEAREPPQVVHEDKIVVAKERPPPVRKDPPLYEDIHHMANLWTREFVCSELDSRDRVAASLGVDKAWLTPANFQCGYYYPGFAEKPSTGGIVDKVSQDFVSASIAAIADRGARCVTTIWAENCSNYMRLAAAGVVAIDVLVPRGFDYSKHDDQEKLLEEFYPDTIVNLLATDIDPAYLASLTSEEFIMEYDLDRTSLFMSTYLPQFSHLKDGFSDYVIIAFDSDATEGLPRVQFDLLPDTKVASEAYLQAWLYRHYPDEMKNSRFSVFVPDRGFIVSHAEHGVFLDYVMDPLRSGKFDFSTISLASFSTSPTYTTKLKVFSKIFHTQVGQNYITAPPEDAVDVSPVADFVDMLYFPCYPLSCATVTSNGTLQCGDTLIAGLPPFRDVYFYNLPGGPKLVDIYYGRKNYNARTYHLDRDYLFVPSNTPDWEYCYAVFPKSHSLVPAFYVSRTAAFSHLMRPPELFFSDVLSFMGVGWNAKTSKLVYDRTARLSWSDLSFAERPGKHNMVFGFTDKESMRHAYHAESGGLHLTVDGSFSENYLTAKECENLCSLFGDNPPLEHMLSKFVDYASSYTI